MQNLTAFISDLKKTCPALEIRENEPMREHTSFKIGGAVAAMVLPKSQNELALVSRAAYQAGIEPLLIGNGTNLLVCDAPLNRLAVKTFDGLCGIELLEETTIRAESGLLLSRLAAFALSHSLAGLAFAHGIPGTVGGAVSMNAGAYGGEMKDVIATVTALNAKGEFFQSAGLENQFSYRHSRFSNSEDIVVSAEFKLTKGDPAEIKANMDALASKRRASQPLNMPSAGSTFKRPAAGYAAAMIEQAGLKGFGIGGAQVSEKHAGFVINRGGATFEDVIKTMEHIQETVFQKFGVMLSPEVKIIR